MSLGIDDRGQFYLTCRAFDRRAPRGQAPPRPWIDLSVYQQWAMSCGLVTAPHYLTLDNFRAGVIPYARSSVLGVEQIERAAVGLQGAIVTRERGMIVQDVKYQPNRFSVSFADLPRAVNLKQYNDTSYYHFVVEVLPRLLVWRDDGETPLLIGIGPAPDYVYQYLEMLGFPRHRIVGVENARVGTLYWPTYRPWCFAGEALFPREPLLELRGRLRRPAVGSKKTAVVFARTGSDPDSREIGNLSDLADVLTRRGWRVERVEFGKMSVGEQIELCSHASLILGASGGDLTNMLWLPDDAVVVEVFTENHPPYQCYWHLAACLGLRYYSLFANSERHADPPILEVVLDDIELLKGNK